MFRIGLFLLFLLVSCSRVAPSNLYESASPYVNKTCPTGIFSDPDIAQVLPQRFVSTLGFASASRVRHVPAGGNLQAALNTAQPGDVITLEPGATYVGPFVLPKLATSTDWVEIRPSSFGTGFPLAGQRVKPLHASLMPKLVTAAGRVIEAAPGASRYRLIGLEGNPAC
jgi:hypothetical protein